MTSPVFIITYFIQNNTPGDAFTGNPLFFEQDKPLFIQDLSSERWSCFIFLQECLSAPEQSLHKSSGFVLIFLSDHNACVTKLDLHRCVWSLFFMPGLFHIRSWTEVRRRNLCWMILTKLNRSCGVNLIWKPLKQQTWQEMPHLLQELLYFRAAEQAWHDILR